MWYLAQLQLYFSYLKKKLLLVFLILSFLSAVLLFNGSQFNGLVSK